MTLLLTTLLNDWFFTIYTETGDGFDAMMENWPVASFPTPALGRPGDPDR